MVYWIDANVFISANNTSYPIGHAIGFWAWLETEIDAGRIKSPRRVYDEVVAKREKKDSLAQWMERRKQKGLCVPPSKDIDALVQDIGDYVWTCSQYQHHARTAFSNGADTWVIAHALQNKAGNKVVTNESKSHPLAKKVRIPDVCKHFGVGCISLPELIRDLDAKF